MSLKMYFDADCLLPILTAEKFVGDGSLTVCALTAFNDAQLGGVYKEKKVTHSTITFSNGVGSGFVGLTIDALKGQRVLFGNRYAGQVTSNTETTVTVSNATFTDLTPQACYIVEYKKLYTPVDFTVASNQITLAVAVENNEMIHAVPLDTLTMYFGGVAGTEVTKSGSIYVKREDNFEYTSLQVSSDDTSLYPYHTAVEDVVFANGTGSGFTGLPVNGLKGKACNHGGTFQGVITSNTATTITIDADYTAAGATAEIYNIGPLEFSIDGTTWARVIHPVDMVAANAAVRQIYYRETLKIPSAAINYPSTIIKVAGIEYIA